MAVNVDVCERPGMPCLATDCTAPARFSVQLGEQPGFDYCGPDARNWIATHQRLDVEIVISDEAKRMLAEVAL